MALAHVNYVQTPNYNTIMETHVFDDLSHGIYADEGAYVVSNNTIFHINKNTPLKGFRGWIVLDDSYWSFGCNDDVCT